MRLPSPHPLDYDWRFDAPTAERLCRLLADRAPVLCLGAPSVARLLEARGADVTLVDRQPIQAVNRHIVAAVEAFAPDRRYRSALVDPPWYPRELETWVRIAAEAVGVGGEIFASVWPPETRPGAQDEVEDALRGFTGWASVGRGGLPLQYQIPRFEVVARTTGGSEMASSPLHGELIKLDVLRPMHSLIRTAPGARWCRFTLNDYQLAVRLRGSDDMMVDVELMPGTRGWRWPYVSARAPGIEKIDVWSSEGEVASHRSGEWLAGVLRQAFLSPDEERFERSLVGAPSLLSWKIPRPPYQRSFEWHHQ